MGDSLDENAAGGVRLKSEGGTGMKKNAAILGIICFFYLAMAAVTVISRRVYLDALPKVRVMVPEGYYAMENGETVSVQMIPAELRNGPVYVVERREKNGEIRMYAKLVTPEFADGEKDGRAMVKSGLSSLSAVISEGFEAVKDGGEVYVENADEIRFW